MSVTFPATEPVNSSKPVPELPRGVESNGEEGDSLRAKIDKLGAQARSTDTTVSEAETIAEELDNLVPTIWEKGDKDYCLRALAEVCREHVVLPESCKISNVERGEERKFGGVADVWMGKYNQKEVCVKVFRQYEGEDQQKLKEALYYRAVRWKYISHLNLLPFLGISETVHPFGLITPRMSGNIIEYTRERQDADRLPLLEEAACGLEYLHSLDIVHGDVNPRNILITSRGTACIGDFGIAEVVADPLVAGECCTMVCRRAIVRYMAPEQLERSVTGRESDVHSFAITAYEVIVGIEPYPGVTGEGPLAVLIMSGTRPPRPENEAAVESLPDHIWWTLESCWVPRPSARPTIGMVHQAFQGTDVTQGSSAPRHRRSTPSDLPRRRAVPQAKYRFARFVRSLSRIRSLRKILKKGSEQ